jgi:hypothetical protein
MSTISKPIAAEKSNNGMISSRGTKELMRSIQSDLKEDVKEELDTAEDTADNQSNKNLMEYEPPFESAKIKRVGEEEYEDDEDSDENFDEDDNEFGL